MKSFSFIQWLVIVILALLTAMEPLCIDLYLPGFVFIAESFSTSTNAVQISLSTFLAGFAVGQLIWGPVADKFGRKKPILVSLIIFTLASVACIYVRTIEQLWLIRFVQAIGGCAGVVISRAVVTDYFHKNQTLKIFALLALIMGIAPIIAPSLGNLVLLFFSWKGLFIAMAALGVILFTATLFCLPETHKPLKTNHRENAITAYIQVLKNKRFVIYSLIAGVVNGALMIYVANGPFLIMEKGGFSNNIFSIIFGVNAFGLMLASYLTTILQKNITTNNLIKYAIIMMTIVSIVLLAAMYSNASIYIILCMLFLYVFPIGILFPTTTELALTPFATTNNSGTASAMFGAIQLAMAFICTLIAGYIHRGNITDVGISFFLCSILAFIIVFSHLKLSNKYSKGVV